MLSAMNPIQRDARLTYAEDGRPQLPAMTKEFTARMSEELLRTYLKQLWSALPYHRFVILTNEVRRLRARQRPAS